MHQQRWKRWKRQALAFCSCADACPAAPRVLRSKPQACRELYHDNICPRHIGHDWKKRAAFSVNSLCWKTAQFSFCSLLQGLSTLDPEQGVAPGARVDGVAAVRRKRPIPGLCLTLNRKHIRSRPVATFGQPVITAA